MKKYAYKILSHKIFYLIMILVVLNVFCALYEKWKDLEGKPNNTTESTSPLQKDTKTKATRPISG